MFDDPSAILKDYADRVIFRLDLKSDDAAAKGLELNLATVRESVDRFFAELADRRRKGTL